MFIWSCSHSSPSVNPAHAPGCCIHHPLQILPTHRLPYSWQLPFRGICTDGTLVVTAPYGVLQWQGYLWSDSGFHFEVGYESLGMGSIISWFLHRGTVDLPGTLFAYELLIMAPPFCQTLVGLLGSLTWTTCLLSASLIVSSVLVPNISPCLPETSLFPVLRGASPCRQNIFLVSRTCQQIVSPDTGGTQATGYYIPNICYFNKSSDHFSLDWFASRWNHHFSQYFSWFPDHNLVCG